jgi:flagellar biosynthetic protein FlhB
MASSDKHSKTEKPTPRRKREARREGKVARTPELVTWVVVLAGTYLVQYTAKQTYALCERLASQVAGAMSHPALSNDLAVVRSAASGALLAIAPALLGSMAIALAINLAQTRGLVTFKPLKPSFKNLNPKNGLSRMFGTRGLWELAKQAVRVALLSLVAWQSVAGLLPLMTEHGPLSSAAIASLVATRALGLAREVAGISLVLAGADYVFQWRKNAQSLRMTKEEIKEEGKQTEGNPVTKGAVRRRQRQFSRNRMIASVAKADAVVLNPTHYAVAVKYVRGQGAPRVIAKGSDLLALRIRQEAVAHRVPLVEDPPLARALYVACEIEQEIPRELYEAVARLLTFIYSLKARGGATRLDGGAHRTSLLVPERARAG